MATIKPKFDFTSSNAAEGYGTHASSRSEENKLKPVLFNEYERVMRDICTAIGDHQFNLDSVGNYEGSPINIDPSATIRGIINNLWDTIGDIHSDKLALTGGTMSGNLTIGSAGSPKTLDVTGTISSRAIHPEWIANHAYVEDDLVVHDGKVLRCKNDHTSSVAFLDDSSNWGTIGSGGTSHDIVLLPEYMGPYFDIGDVLYYDNGYKLAKADDLSTLAQFIVVAKADNWHYTVMSEGYVDFGSPVLSTQNSWFYLSDTVAGGLTTSMPSLGQKIIKSIDQSTGYVSVTQPYSGGAILETDEFTYLSGDPVFTLSRYPITRDHMFVFIDGIQQNDSSYTLDGKELTIDLASGEVLMSGQTLQARYINMVSSPLGANIQEYLFTATGAYEEEFTFATGMSVPNPTHLNVSIDGVTMTSNDYSLLSEGTGIYFPEVTLMSGDTVRVQCFEALNLYAVPQDDTITTDMLKDSIVTTVKIADGSVTSDKLANEDITFQQDVYIPSGTVHFSDYDEKVTSLGIVSGEVTIPVGATVYEATLSGDISLTIAEPTIATGRAKNFVFIAEQDSVGGHTISWPANVRTAYSVEPTIDTDPNSESVVSFIRTHNRDYWFLITNGTAFGALS